MKKIIAYIFLIVLFFVNSVFAQSNYKIELSGGRITSGLQNTLLPYWDTGWSLGITASKQINKEIELTSSFRIQNFRFQPFKVGLVTIDVVGYSVRVSGGENSDVYNFSLGVRILSSTGRIKTFLSLSGGFQYIDQGKIFITSSNITTFKGKVLSTTSNTYLYNSSNRNYLMGIVSMGVGLSFKIISKINLITEGRLVTTLTKTTSYPVLSAGIQYSFLK